MLHVASIEGLQTTVCTELILSDRLIALAEDADRAGYTHTAERLVTLACTVFDEAAQKPH
jgi:hypothetical protein